MSSCLGDDVIYWKSLVGKNVSIRTVDNHNHEGTVFVIDPIYKTVVLTKTDTNSLEFVLDHAIQSFTVLSDDRDDSFVQKSETDVCSEDVLHKKTKLVKWLKHMFLDVKEDKELIKVEDHLIIGPPYGREDCMCDNTIVLERIRKIIELMPPDFM